MVTWIKIKFRSIFDVIYPEGGHRWLNIEGGAVSLSTLIREHPHQLIIL